MILEYLIYTYLLENSIFQYLYNEKLPKMWTWFYLVYRNRELPKNIDSILSSLKLCLFSYSVHKISTLPGANWTFEILIVCVQIFCKHIVCVILFLFTFKFIISFLISPFIMVVQFQMPFLPWKIFASFKSYLINHCQLLFLGQQIVFKKINY